MSSQCAVWRFGQKHGSAGHLCSTSLRFAEIFWRLSASSFFEQQIGNQSAETRFSILNS